MRLIAALTALLVVVGPFTADAAPRRYALQPELSSVGYETDFGPDKITGTMPVTQADLTLDFAGLANSTVAVTLNAAKATASRKNAPASSRNATQPLANGRARNRQKVAQKLT